MLNFEPKFYSVNLKDLLSKSLYSVQIQEIRGQKTRYLEICYAVFYLSFGAEYLELERGLSPQNCFKDLQKVLCQNLLSPLLHHTDDMIIKLDLKRINY